MKDISMMTPSEIAFKYDGNKRQIAMAVQKGILDPTAAALAGIFIDRTLQSNLRAPETTVYEDMYSGEGGVAGLPVPEDMVPNEYAGGGIVAFANRGAVSLTDIVAAQQARDPFYDEDEESGDVDVDKLRRLAMARRQLRAEGPTEAREEAREFYKKAGERAAGLSKKQIGLAGLGAAGALLSTRGSVGKALAEAEKAARPGLQKALETEASGEESRIRGLLGLEEKERAEMAEDIKGAENVLARKISAGPRSNQMDRYVKLQTDAAIEKGDTRPRGLIEAEFADKFIQFTAAPRAEQAGAASYRSTIDAGQYAMQLRDKNRRIYNLANQPITRDTPPDTATRIREAQRRRDELENEIRRVTGFIGGPPAAGGGGSGGGGGGGRGQVDTSNPLLR